METKYHHPEQWETSMDFKTSEFSFGGVSLGLTNGITYHDHLYRIKKALWPQFCAEVAKTQAKPLSIDDSPLLLAEEFGPAAAKNDFFSGVATAAVDAIVPLGYDRNKMSTTVSHWLTECIADGLRAVQMPEIYGPGRYAIRDLAAIAPKA
jgi:hypothetical protein